MRYNYPVTDSNIQSLLPNQIFVFGSNEAGAHGAGAAKTALDKFGAVYGKGVGLHGNSYALPTKDNNISTLPIDKIGAYVDELFDFATTNHTLQFLITEVGCGLAGYTAVDIAPLFNKFIVIPNCTLPQSFLNILAPNDIIKGFKAFNKDDEGIYCRNFRFEIGGFYKEDSAIICNKGFHFCEKIIDTLNYYSRNESVVYCEVIGWGQFDSENDKVCTSNIHITSLYNHNHDDFNSGNWNSGNRNSSNWNSGDGNSGNRNSGNWNSGDGNSGDGNSGDGNSGNRNSGNRNSGDWNSGNRNSGNRNSGDGNSGDWNSGDWNSGNWNSGNRNSGDWNSGNWNSGNRNSGDWNSGNRNSGNRNSGNRNSGDWNSGNGKNRFLCSEETPTYFFNKISDKKQSDVYFPNWMYFDLLVWKRSSDMTEDEKMAYPLHETCGGWLFTLDYKEAAQASYNRATKPEQDAVENIPNYDAQVLYDIFGIDRRIK